MLDVGCGDKPHWRADVLVDRFPDDGHASQRNSGGAVVSVAPLFEASLESLPFRDASFDYVYCSHVLEHVENPTAALAEMQRVGKAGYIEVPFVGIQKIYDQESHLWMCDQSGRELIFTAKDRAVFDHDIERFLLSGALKPLALLMNLYQSSSMIRMTWGPGRPIVARVVGKPDIRLAHLARPSAKRGSGAWLFARNVLQVIHPKQKRRLPVSYNEIIQDRYRREADVNLARSMYRLVDGIYVAGRNP